jgi:hypothetical protein
MPRKKELYRLSRDGKRPGAFMIIRERPTRLIVADVREWERNSKRSDWSIHCKANECAHAIVSSPQLAFALFVAHYEACHAPAKPDGSQ